MRPGPDPEGRPLPRDVVFDLGGVLVDWDPRYLLCGRLDYTPEAADRFLAQICTPAWHARLDAGLDFTEAADELALLHPEHAAAIRAYTSEWHRMFAGEFPASVRLLRALKAAGFRLHALSNYPGEQIAFLYHRFAFMREFDTVVLSGLLGVRKPAAEIYEYLLERIGTRDCVFLDDRPENVAAAKACGIRAKHYTPPPAGADLRLVMDAAGLGEVLDGRLPKPK